MVVLSSFYSNIHNCIYIKVIKCFDKYYKEASMITISESAKTKIKDLLYEEGNPNLALRTFVQGGGCSGFSYGFTFDEITNEDDFEIPLDEFKVLVDSMSMTYLQGAEIDYKEELMGSSFTIKNPNATTTCGCGSSFGV
jgi:iron-sulfur cluster insertion protein